MAAPLEYQDDYPKQAIDIMKRGRGIVSVAAHFQVRRETIYKWRNTYPDFDDACHIGRIMGEAYMHEIGFQGIGKKEFNHQTWAKLMQVIYNDPWDRRVQIDGLDGCKTYDEEISCVARNVANGNLTPAEGERVANIISAKVKAFEVTRARPLIEQLEQQNK